MTWLHDYLDTSLVDTRPEWGEPRSLTAGWSPSLVGEPDDRTLVAKVLGYRGPEVDARLVRIFDCGDAVEATWVERFTKLGVLRRSSDSATREVDGVTLSGRYDLLITHPSDGRLVLVEVKSMNPYGFQRLPVEGTPVENYQRLNRSVGSSRVQQYLRQVDCYLQLFEVEVGLLLVENKGNQEFRAYDLVVDRGRWLEIRDRLKRLESHWVAREVPPVTASTGDAKLASYRPGDVVPLVELREWCAVQGRVASR